MTKEISRWIISQRIKSIKTNYIKFLNKLSNRTLDPGEKME